MAYKMKGFCYPGESPLKQKDISFKLPKESKKIISGGIESSYGDITSTGVGGGLTAGFTYNPTENITIVGSGGADIHIPYSTFKENIAKNLLSKPTVGYSGDINITKTYPSGSEIGGGVSFSRGQKPSFNIKLVKTFGSKK